MALSPEELRIHARHLLLDEIGEEGQARLLASSFRFEDGAEERVERSARTYLERAGLDERASGDLVSLPSGDAIARLAGRLELEPAGAALAAALASVEQIKRSLEVGSSGGSFEGIVLSRRAE